MKFTIKHALVVAISALCICVVATGIVVAVTMNNREAAAGASATPITFTAEPPRGFVAVGPGFPDNQQDLQVARTITPVAGVTYMFATQGSWSFDRIRFNGGAWVPLRTDTRLALPSNRVENRIVLHWAPDSGIRGTYSRIWLEVRFYGRATLPADHNVPITSIQFGMEAGFHGFTPVAVADVEHTVTRVVRSAATGTATTTAASTFAQGFHAIPEPTNQLGTFRGWALQPGGTLLFPRGLPVPVFSTKRLYAVHV